MLTGRITPDRVFDGDDLRRTNPRFSQDNLQRVSRFASMLAPVAETHGVNVGEVVIAWTLAQPGITFSLCGARNAEQAIENARAGTVYLSDDELGLIDSAIAEHLGPVAQAA